MDNTKHWLSAPISSAQFHLFWCWRLLWCSEIVWPPNQLILHWLCHQRVRIWFELAMYHLRSAPRNWLWHWVWLWPEWCCAYHCALELIHLPRQAPRHHHWYSAADMTRTKYVIILPSVLKIKRPPNNIPTPVRLVISIWDFKVRLTFCLGQIMRHSKGKTTPMNAAGIMKLNRWFMNWKKPMVRV